jgi:hypothetical protein
MRVRANHDISRPGQRFTDQLVADALAQVRHSGAALFGELAQKKMVIGQRLVGAGHSVIKEDHRFPGIGQALEAAGLELPHRQRPGGILNENQVDRGDDDIPGPCVTTGPVAQYLFSERLTHAIQFPFPK